VFVLGFVAVMIGEVDRSVEDPIAGQRRAGAGRQEIASDGLDRLTL
jgi:hypothetical protein